MKFNHKFEKIGADKSTMTFKSEGTNARIDFISSSAIRVAIYNDKEDMLPTFNVSPNNELIANGRDRLSLDGFDMACPDFDGDEIRLNDDITIRLNLDNFLLSYYNRGRLLFSDRAPLAYNIDGEFGDGVCHYISRYDDERIYGLGDKSGDMNKAGKCFRIEASDSMGYDASSSDPLYKHVPFYICDTKNGAYGIYYDTSDTSYIDLGREINNYYEHFKFFKSEDNCLVYYVFFGTRLEIVRQFGRLIGKQAFPPRWSFDYCASTMAYTDAPKSEKKMNEFLDKVRDSGLSCSGFYLSSGYTSIGKGRYVFNWNYDKFPDPKGFIKDFANNGINIIPNIKPAFLQDHPMYKDIEKEGLFIKNSDGTPFVTQFWDGLGSYLDFTNPKAFEFWEKQVEEKLINNGIIATWNDNNEFDIKDRDAVAAGFGKEVNARRIRPALTYLMVCASYAAQVKCNPQLRPFLSTRSGSPAVRRLAQTWSGDNFTSFRDLKYCHYIGLTMSLSGFHFYGHDLGGFSGDMPDRELLLRWIQHGVFEPRFTIHSWNSDGTATMPWSYEDILDNVREIFSQRKQLMPYLYNCAYNSVENEIPINAPLFLYYNDDEIDINSPSMMLGRDILVTFILDRGKEEAQVYLPENEIWYLKEKKYIGGQKVDLKIPATSRVPYFVRGGSVIPTDEAEYGFKKEEKTVFTVYPIEKGSFESEFFCDDGISCEYTGNNCTRLVFNVECKENEIIVKYENIGRNAIIPSIILSPADNRFLTIFDNNRQIFL